MTLVEVVIALSIAGILVTIGLLRATTMTSRYQLAIAAEQVAADLQRARLEAVRRNTTVTFKRTSLTQYQIPGVVTRNLTGGIAFATTAPDSVRFSSRGRLVGGAASLFQVQYGATTKGVSITPGGAMTVQ